jgi:hypothetical protein
MRDRCYQRHGISRLPDMEDDKAAKKAKLYLFVAIDRTSKFVFAELQEKATGKARQPS